MKLVLLIVLTGKALRLPSLDFKGQMENER